MVTMWETCFFLYSVCAFMYICGDWLYSFEYCNYVECNAIPRNNIVHGHATKVRDKQAAKTTNLKKTLITQVFIGKSLEWTALLEFSLLHVDFLFLLYFFLFFSSPVFLPIFSFVNFFSGCLVWNCLKAFAMR